MHAAKEELLRVLWETRRLLVLPDNDFVWSWWDDETEALAEFDSLVANIESGRRFDLMELSVLYAPTGPIQEVSISSGWGKKFLEVAEAFDAALENYRR